MLFYIMSESINLVKNITSVLMTVVVDEIDIILIDDNIV